MAVFVLPSTDRLFGNVEQLFHGGHNSSFIGYLKRAVAFITFSFSHFKSSNLLDFI